MQKLKKIFIMMSVLAATLLFATPTLASEVYDLLANANENVEAADSILLTTNAAVTISTTIFGETIAFEVVQNAEIAQVFVTETDFNASVLNNLNLDGYDWSMNYYIRNGVIYSEYLGHWEIVDYFSLEDILGQDAVMSLLEFSDEFPMEALESATVTRNPDNTTTITFLVPADYAQSFVDETVDAAIGVALGIFGTEMPQANVTANTVAVTVLLDANGNFYKVALQTNINLVYLGMNFNIDLYAATEILQLGGVTIDFPAEIDALSR
ncbi:MAG: hypothetical protein FWG68_07270 [Defluviitaleaceae bacterium]|nr:hypothetical protein [Defluviitaleaceae bacterium]